VSYSCNHCGLTSDSQTRITEHIKRHHGSGDQADLDKRIAQERHDTQLEELKWFKMRLHQFSERKGHEHALFFLRSTVDERIANLQAALGKE
jgi:hypothetical protein